MNLTPEQLQDIGSVLADAMSLYPGSRETPDYAVRVAALIRDADIGQRVEAWRAANPDIVAAWNRRPCRVAP